MYGVVPEVKVSGVEEVGGEKEDEEAEEEEEEEEVEEGMLGAELKMARGSMCTTESGGERWSFVTAREEVESESSEGERKVEKKDDEWRMGRMPGGFGDYGGGRFSFQ